MDVLDKTLFFGVTVGDRTWVRLRYCGLSYPNPITVTYGHPEISVKKKNEQHVRSFFFNFKLKYEEKKLRARARA